MRQHVSKAQAQMEEQAWCFFVRKLDVHVYKYNTIVTKIYHL